MGDPYFLVPVTLHHTILVPYPLDPGEDISIEKAVESAKDDPDLHELFPAVERGWDPSCSVEGWWDVEDDLDSVLSAYQSCRDGRQALAQGLMALMIQ